MAQTPNRPLSPHISIWRWGPAMLVSILHRMSGNGLAVVGGLVLTAWLVSLAMGEECYQHFASIMGSIPGLIVLIGLSWAFFQHLLSGLRHFVLDVGAGFEVDTNNRWSAALPVLSVIMTALMWAWLLLR